ncbi:MAG: carboxypeptidase regulatory-like domain-containing protein [Candidatus Brocadiaceae bacterium]|uniref:RCC1 domain-containing protein n=1 Tax=Candidatus Wunengus sp. YC61 TaxID=3367698 RepID=UPI002716B160|nr:carboxypeptidase regulatory-like domain-containing protein [Candidatus Brocadiaceae bacterium]
MNKLFCFIQMQAQEFIFRISLYVLILFSLILTAIGTSSASVNPKVSAGSAHTIALKSDGTVWTWGYNGQGQLGDRTYTDKSTPVQVSKLSGLNKVIEIAGGRYLHTLALKSDGTVWAWGYNGSGQLGNNTYTDKNIPIQVSGLSDVLAVACGGNHSLALKSDGTVWAWGDNGSGQLGDGTTDVKTSPVQVNGLNGITAIACGIGHTLALKSDGTLWVWGWNEYGQLGDGTTSNKTSPVQVSKLSDVIAVAGGMEHSIALKSDGTVWTWGYNGQGQLGYETRGNTSTTPDQVLELSNVTVIACGGMHSLALKSDGTVWVWGENTQGQLGDGTTSNKTSPVQVSKLSDITAIAGGSSHSIALKSDGTVWTWGSNDSGQLGDGTNTDSTTPVQVNINLNQIEISTPTPTYTPIPTSTPTVIASPTPQPFPTITPLPTAIPSQTPTPGGSGMVYGFVYNADEESLKNVTVNIIGNNFSDSTTDEDGYYEFTGITEGDYTLTYEKSGYQTHTEDISIGEGEDMDMGTIIMETVEKGMIYGYVVNIKGNPLEYGRLKLKGISTKKTKQTSSDADGFFEFSDLDADTYIITAKKKGFKPVNQRIKLGDGEVTDIEIEMKKSSRRIAFVEH